MRFVIIILALLIGVYPIVHFLSEEPFGLLTTKPPTILKSTWWQLAFYLHITFSGISLLIGWIQFSKGRLRAFHREIGYAYVLSVMIGAISGLYIAFSATGGLISSIGFIALGIGWFYFTVVGYYQITLGKIQRHKTYMLYSYALCFAAVTLRLWLPILVLIFEDFIVAYQIVAWLCWIPNIILIFYMNKKTIANKTASHNPKNQNL